MHWSPRSEPFAALKPLDKGQPSLDHDSLRMVMDLTLWTAQLQLKSGAQSARVERTAHLLSTALGADWIDVVVLQEGLVLTTSSGEEFRTRVRRIPAVGVNLSTLHAIAKMTSDVWAGVLDRDGVAIRLKEIESSEGVYSRLVTILSVGLACGAFACLFGAEAIGFAVTCFASSCAMWVRQELSRKHYNPLLNVIATAFVAGIPPCLAQRTGVLVEGEASLAACVLLLVPGVPFINAARDVLRGYMIAGIARGFQGLLISLCIALGLGTALTLCGLEFRGAPSEIGKNSWSYIATDALWSGIAAAGFAILFNVPRLALPICILTGACGHALRTFLSLSAVPFLLSTLLAACGVGVIAELFARRTRAPAGLVAVPGAIPLVPGVMAFRSMSGILNLISPRLQGHDLTGILSDTVRNFTSTGLLLASLALGIALPSLLLKRHRVSM